MAGIVNNGTAPRDDAWYASFDHPNTSHSDHCASSPFIFPRWLRHVVRRMLRRRPADGESCSASGGASCDALGDAETERAREHSAHRGGTAWVAMRCGRAAVVADGQGRVCRPASRRVQRPDGCHGALCGGRGEPGHRHRQPNAGFAVRVSACAADGPNHVVCPPRADGAGWCTGPRTPGPPWPSCSRCRRASSGTS